MNFGISKDEFEKPDLLTIETECDKYLNQEMNELNEIITQKLILKSDNT